MKTHIRPLVLALVAMLSATTQAADTPAAIASDYRKAADIALVRLNATLDAEAAKVSKTLLALNDAAAVQSLAEQVQAKRAGEPVAQPVPQAVALFASYDRARIAALAPVQQTTLRRIEAVLASSDGHKTEIVAELAEIRQECTAGLVSKPAIIAAVWNYHMTPDKNPNGTVTFKPDGTFELKIENRRSPEIGTYKPGKRRHHYDLTIDKEQFTMIVNKDTAVMERAIGKRYLTLAIGQK